MNHIFISYQRESEADVTKLAERLRKEAKLEVWQDLSGKDTGIPYSVKWWEVIRSALYSAAGAVIIRTEPWENSGPCSKEFVLIKANRIPYLTVEENELKDPDTLVRRIKAWHDTKLTTEENQDRTLLFAQSYRMKQDRKISHLLAGRIGFFSSLEEYRKCNRRAKYLKNSGIEETRPIAAARMADFLRKAKRKLLRVQIVRGLVILGGIAGIIMLAAAIRALPYLLQNSYASDYRGKSTAVIDLIEDIGEYDPVSSMTLLTTDLSARNLDVTQSFFLMQRTMAEMLNRQWPVDFYAAGSEEAAAVQALESHDYPAASDPAAGNLTVPVNGIETSLMQDCAPGAYCYVPERNELLVAADRTIRAYDLDEVSDGIPLEYNFEAVSRITADGNRVYGITDKGNVVCWENPVPVKTVRRNLSEGILLPGGAAAYAGSEGLLLQEDGKERIIPAPVRCSGVLAVSEDRKLAAVAGQDETGEYRIALIRTESGETAAVYEVPGRIYSLAFSRDGALLYGTALDALVRIDVSSGQVAAARADGDYYAVARYLDHVVVGRTDGMVAEFGSDLRQLSRWAEITVGTAPAKMLAVSEAYGTVFAACRGGNTIAGCRRITLADGAISRFALEAEAGMVSTNCVAVSEDGEFVAYGFPNGQITVWSTDTMNELYVCRPAAEPLISLRFEKDGIRGLGKSGTVYRSEFGGLVRKVERETLREYWSAYAEKSADVHRRMYELGLTYIVP